jgi:hypothetical protein
MVPMVTNSNSTTIWMAMVIQTRLHGIIRTWHGIAHAETWKLDWKNTIVLGLAEQKNNIYINN